jgi:hypothetical protein
MKSIVSIRLGAAVAAVLVVAGCSSDAASYLIDGPDTSLTLVREKPYFWSKNWELSLVATRLPECMRRHELKPATDNGFKLEVFRTLEGGYILKQDGNWYVVDLQQCRLQTFTTPPREPGDRAGAFEVKDGRLQFVAVGQ